MSSVGDRIIIVLPLVLSLVVVALSPQSNAAGSERTLIFTPWSTRAEIISRVASTGARIVRLGAVPFVVVVRTPENGKPLHIPELIATLHTAFGGCGQTSGVSL